MTKRLVSFYRISDLNQQTSQGGDFNKTRPSFWSKQESFLNFLSVFGTEHLFVIADAVGETTRKFLKSKVPSSQIFYTNFRSGASSFLFAARTAQALPDDVNVYFVEDDYLHTDDAKICLLNALEIADYATGYDAPDKYVNAGKANSKGCPGNPNIDMNSEQTRLYVGAVCHFKQTNSTTMTFCCKARTVKQDFPIFLKYCQNHFPYDYQMFRELITMRERILVSTVPAKSAHCESAHLAPLVDWESVIRNCKLPIYVETLNM